MPIWWENLRGLMSLQPAQHAALPDLRDLDSERVRVQGTHYLVHDRERETRGDRVYVLRREPKNRRDSSAVAVYAQGRAVGYVGTERAALLSPLLETLGGAAVVNGLGSDAGGVRLWVDLPTAPALQAYVGAREHAA